MNEPIDAKGLAGHLQWSGENYYFRVYNENGSFKDYNIMHCDLEVTINDSDAFLYPTPQGLWDGVLDHSPSTHGK